MCKPDPRAATPALKAPARPLARAPSRQRFELRCADIHAVGCNEMLRGASFQAVVARACEHGALAHGFTAVWYSPKRLAVMAEAVTQRA
jgi:predicted small metal-binding protein